MLAKLLKKQYRCFSTEYLNKIKRLSSEGKYEQIFEVNPQNTSKSQLKQKYNTLIKRYHADKNQNSNEKGIYEEISKIIIQSYRNLSKKYETRSKEEFKEGDNELENQISQRLFNKNFNQIKYWIYQKGNEGAKKIFLAEFYKKTGRNYEYQTEPSQKQKEMPSRQEKYYNKESRNYNYKPQSQGDNYYGLAIVGVVSLLGLFFYSSFKKYEIKQIPKQKPNSVAQDFKYSEQNIRRINLKKDKQRQEKAEIMINSIIKDHPPSIKYPNEEPHIMRQLTQYSIAPDIHLYEVSPHCYKGVKRSQIIQKGLQKSKKDVYELSKIKPNTTMTLSLQAERALQNVYVKVTDVIDQIKRTGKYKPPQIFLRFHGYVMCQIREKPLTMTNYKNTDYISLFDLFFEYYSPIFLKHDQFSQYLVCKDQIDYFGWVHLNNKKCQPVYLKPGEKAAFFHSKQQYNEELYQKIWNDYYKLSFVE